MRRDTVHRHRFTPTCVGTATTPRCLPPPSRVHPHVRGDGTLTSNLLTWKTGSPPRAWGRHIQGVFGEFIRGFTPTCVGTGWCYCREVVGSSVHPHVRGDGSAYLLVGRPVIGSPPRAWGRPVDNSRVGGAIRFTPTCVGTAKTWCVRTVRRWVHPHVRGDGAPPFQSGRAPVGSPPRAWGRLRAPCDGSRGDRFTPTCVGTAQRRGERWQV